MSKEDALAKLDALEYCKKLAESVGCYGTAKVLNHNMQVLREDIVRMYEEKSPEHK